MTMTSARERLIEATRELLWDRGFSATSPGAILKTSGVGQGSMYHHFSGKEDLALAAIGRNAEDMRAQVTADLAAPGGAVARIAAFLHRERDVLRGCRFGRLAQDPDVVASAAMHTEVADMFAWLCARLAEVLEDGRASGELPESLDAGRTAATVAATLQGGYVLARAAGDAAPFDDAVDGLLGLLAALAAPEAARRS